LGVGWQGGSMEVAGRWQRGGSEVAGRWDGVTRYRVRPSLVFMLRGPSKEDRGKTRDLG